MTAIATLHALADTASRPSPSAGPLVFVDGELRDDLRVMRMTRIGPTDRREATIAMLPNAAGYSAAERARIDTLIDRIVTIVQPVALAGGEHRMIGLLHGRLRRWDHRLDDQHDELTLRAICSLSEMLDAPVTQVVDAGSVESVLTQIATHGGFTLDLDTLDVASRESAVPAGDIRGGTIGSVLEHLLDAFGLNIQREMTWDGSRIEEQRRVRRVRFGRRVRLGMTDVAEPAGVVDRIRTAIRPAQPVKYVARARGQIVESTFSLLPAWNPALESLDDEAYGQSTGGDFDAVSNVFRLWVLNEDGAFDGETFDLTALFAEGFALEPQPIVFGSSLTRDDADRSMGVVVDVSFDDGANWHRYGGDVRVLRDRAGVYFDDDVLSGAFIAASKAGLLRVRVTATLRSPLSIDVVRWRGNPFAGSFRTRRIDWADVFAWRRVDASSKYAASIDAGDRRADVIDTRDAMKRWLAQFAANTPMLTGEAEVVTAGVMIGLRLGDRLEQLAGRSIAMEAGDPSSAGLNAGPVLVKMEQDWQTATSRLYWRGM